MAAVHIEHTGTFNMSGAADRNGEGLIDLVCAESRAQLVAGVVTHAPWQCRFWNYATRDGMRVPLDGEAAWVSPKGLKPYFRGHITQLSYEFAR